MEYKIEQKIKEIKNVLKLHDRKSKLCLLKIHSPINFIQSIKNNVILYASQQNVTIEESMWNFNVEEYNPKKYIHLRQYSDEKIKCMILVEEFKQFRIFLLKNNIVTVNILNKLNDLLILYRSLLNHDHMYKENIIKSVVKKESLEDDYVLEFNN